LKRTKLI